MNINLILFVLFMYRFNFLFLDCRPTPTVKSQRLAAIEVLGDAIKSLLPESSAELFNYRALVLSSVEELV